MKKSPEQVFDWLIIDILLLLWIPYILGTYNIKRYQQSHVNMYSVQCT